MRTPALRDSFRFVLPILLLAPGMAQAQTTEQPSADIQQREHIEQQLKELRDQQQALLNSMQKQVADFNARIAAMEAELASLHRKINPPRRTRAPKALHRFRPPQRMHPRKPIPMTTAPPRCSPLPRTASWMSRASDI